MPALDQAPADEEAESAAAVAAVRVAPLLLWAHRSGRISAGGSAQTEPLRCICGGRAARAPQPHGSAPGRGATSKGASRLASDRASCGAHGWCWRTRLHADSEGCAL